MLRGVYSAATGMIAQSKKINTLGNNITNVNTVGFKSDRISLRSFDEEMAYRMDEGLPVGNLSVGVGVGGIAVDFTQGPIRQTGISTHLAVSGGGFFAVEAVPGAGGVKYTRAGGFQVDAGGYLALPSGERLLGSDGRPIYTGGNRFEVAQDGRVTVNGGNAGVIMLYQAQGGNILKRRDGFYDITAPTQAAGVIMQGYVEDSNAEPVDELTGLMQAQRSFQSCQQALSDIDETLDKLISQVGSLRG